MKNDLAIFEGHEIRRLYDEKTETWWLSVVDIIRVLTQQPDHRKAQSYWTTLKNRLKSEGSQVVTNCDHLKMPAADGKSYLTDAATAKTGGRIAKKARLELESKTGQKVVTRDNYLLPTKSATQIK